MSYSFKLTVPNKIISSLIISTSLLFHPIITHANNNGANDLSNSKILGGGASTLQQGISVTITRGVILDGSNFSKQDLHGVSFQQSVIRNSDFHNSNLQSASFFG